MEHSQEAASRLVVARGQASKLLGEAEEALDFVAVTIQIAVNSSLGKAVFLAGNHHADPQCFDVGHGLVGVVAFIGQHVTCPCGRGQQLAGPAAVGLLTRAQQQAQRVVQGVDQGVDFGRQPAPAAAKGSSLTRLLFGRPLPAHGLARWSNRA